MSSTYYILCLNHDPAIALDMSFGNPDEAIQAVKERGDDSAYELRAHKDCDLVISRHSGAVVAIYDPQYEEWTAVEWLRFVLSAVYTHGVQYVKDYLRLPGKWTVERVLKLRDELDDGREPVPSKFSVSPYMLCTHDKKVNGKCLDASCPNYVWTDQIKENKRTLVTLQDMNGGVNQYLTVPMPDGGHVSLLIRPDLHSFQVYYYAPGEDLGSMQRNTMEVPKDVAREFVRKLADSMAIRADISDVVLSYVVRVPDSGLDNVEPGDLMPVHPSDVTVTMKSGWRLVAEGP